jgi:hypothetical protein
MVIVSEQASPVFGSIPLVKSRVTVTNLRRETYRSMSEEETGGNKGGPTKRPGNNEPIGKRLPRNGFRRGRPWHVPRTSTTEDPSVPSGRGI